MKRKVIRTQNKENRNRKDWQKARRSHHERKSNFLRFDRPEEKDGGEVG